MKLNKTQRKVLVGTLLGDAHLETQNGGRTYRLKVEHSEKQKDYIEYLFGVFKNLCEQKELTKKKNRGFISYEFRTKSLGTFRFYAQQFYQDGKKRVPKIIRKLLKDPLSLAIWFADDGSKKSNKHKTYIIHTLAFKKAELKLLQEALKLNFGIEARIHKNRNGYRLYIPSSSASKFEEFIKPFIEKIPSLKKKLVTQMPKK